MFTVVYRMVSCTSLVISKVTGKCVEDLDSVCYV